MPSGIRAQLPLLALMAATLVVAALFVLLVPGFPFAVVSIPLDVLVNDTALLVGGAVVWLALLRYRERGDAASGMIGAAFLVAVALNLLVITTEASGADAALGMSLAAPTQEPLYLHGGARLIMSLTLLAGGLAATGRWHPARRWTLVVLPLVVALALGLAIHVVWESLPAWVGDEGLRQLAAQDTGEPLQGVTAVAVAMQSVSALAFLAAAILYAAWRPEPSSPFPAFLAVALVLGAASEVQFLVYPGSFSGLVGSNDVVRLGFALVMMVGVAADLRSSSRALVRAEAEVSRLREAELASAALVERTRLAREIHDGLSQHLWLAKLRLGEVTPEQTPAEILARVDEVAALVDTGLVEAQQTIAALREGAADRPLVGAIRTYAETFSQQRGLPVDVELDEGLGEVPPRIGAELLRVVQEACANVARHADATRIVVSLSRDGRDLLLAVSDNGIGFEASRHQGGQRQGFGLTSMRERVEGLGGRLEIESAPSAGTTVRVSVPLP